METINIDNNNFDDLKYIASTFTPDIKYIIYYDLLNSKNKKYLSDNNIDKSRITIITADRKKVPAKYKHQIQTEASDKKYIDSTLKKIFAKGGDNTEILKELNEFSNLQILLWLESTSIACPKILDVLSNVEKYVYTQHFKELVVLRFNGAGCIPYFKSLSYNSKN